MTSLNNTDLQKTNGGVFWESLVVIAYAATAATEGVDAANCLLLGYVDGLTGGDHSDLCGG